MKEYPEAIVAAFLSSWRPKQIMETAGISKSRYYKLKNDSDFQKVLTERRSEIVRAAVMQMESYLSEDIQILQGIIRDPKTSPQIKINGINLLMTQLNNWKQTTEILTRLEKLEDAQSHNNAV